MDPESARQVGIVERDRKKTQKTEILTSIDECTWRTSKKGGLRADNHLEVCCINRMDTCNGLETWLDQSTSLNKQSDVATTVGAVRRYVKSLDTVAFRQFLTQYTYFRSRGYDAADAAGNSQIRKASKTYDYYLPRLDWLKERLEAAATTGQVMSPPTTDSIYSVCSRWFYFVLGVCTDRVHDAGLKKALYQSSAFAPARDLDVGVVANRKQYKKENRESLQKKHVIAWLLELASISEQLPNAARGERPVVVLPTRTVQATHRLYVVDSEAQLGASWAEDQRTAGPYTPPEAEYADEIKQAFEQGGRVGILLADSGSEDVDEAGDNDRLAQADNGVPQRVHPPKKKEEGSTRPGPLREQKMRASQTRPTTISRGGYTRHTHTHLSTYRYVPMNQYMRA